MAVCPVKPVPCLNKQYMILIAQEQIGQNKIILQHNPASVVVDMYKVVFSP